MIKRKYFGIMIEFQLNVLAHLLHQDLLNSPPELPLTHTSEARPTILTKGHYPIKIKLPLFASIHNWQPPFTTVEAISTLATGIRCFKSPPFMICITHRKGNWASHRGHLHTQGTRKRVNHVQFQNPSFRSYAVDLSRGLQLTPQAMSFPRNHLGVVTSKRIQASWILKTITTVRSLVASPLAIRPIVKVTDAAALIAIGDVDAVAS